MPKIKDKDNTPKELRPFIFHGLDISWEENAKNTEQFECPWCGAYKISINIQTSVWSCYDCKESGNGANFLEKLWLLSYDSTTMDHYKDLTLDRPISVTPDTLVKWHVALSVITGEWIIPGYGTGGSSMVNLYRYSHRKVLGTPDRGAQLFGMNLFKDSAETNFICEGPWDAMFLWETLNGLKRNNDGDPVLTSSQTNNMGSTVNVVGVPGCTTFHDRWASLFKDTDVIICFDNDPIRKDKKGNYHQPAAYEGAKRLAGILHGYAKTIHYVKMKELVPNS